jgi:hypothetical protein
MKIFSTYSKWIPIVIYDVSGSKFLLMGRRNLDTGMLHFKGKMMNNSFQCNHNISQNIFDPTKQFEELLNTKS